MWKEGEKEKEEKGEGRVWEFWTGLIGDNEQTTKKKKKKIRGRMNSFLFG